MSPSRLFWPALTAALAWTAGMWGTAVLVKYLMGNL